MLFEIFLDKEFNRGAFHTIASWSKRSFGADDPLSLMLDGDQRWLSLWREVRNALEHPKEDYYVKINNFRLLPSREIQLPTWQLKHPQFPDVFRPQQLVRTLELHEANILGFFENLLLVLTDKAMKSNLLLGVADLDEDHRDPDCPKRYKIQVLGFRQSSVDSYLEGLYSSIPSTEGVVRHVGGKELDPRFRGDDSSVYLRASQRSKLKRPGPATK